MQRGIFQGCPISPYLFLFVIEILALSVRQNEQVKGIKVKNHEVNNIFHYLLMTQSVLTMGQEIPLTHCLIF